MPLHLVHPVPPRLTWAKPDQPVLAAREPHCAGASADLRAYVRAFSAPLVPVAVVAALSLVAASCAAG